MKGNTVEAAVLNKICNGTSHAQGVKNLFMFAVASEQRGSDFPSNGLSFKLEHRGRSNFVIFFVLRAFLDFFFVMIEILISSFFTLTFFMYFDIFVFTKNID